MFLTVTASLSHHHIVLLSRNVTYSLAEMQSSLHLLGSRKKESRLRISVHYAYTIFLSSVSWFPCDRLRTCLCVTVMELMFLFHHKGTHMYMQEDD